MKCFRFFTLLFSMLCLLMPIGPQAASNKAFSHPPPALAFCLYSSAEAFNLVPVLKRLEDKGISFRILAFGAAKHTLRKTHAKRLIPLDKKLDELGQAGCWHPGEELSDKQKYHLFSLLKGSKLLVSGIASQVQADIIKEAKRLGMPCIGYLDSFESLEDHPFLSQALCDLKALLVPTESHIKTAKSLQKKLSVIAVGKAEVDALLSQAKAADQKHLEKEKKRLIAELKLDPKKQILVYCSGYGNAYEEGFYAFAHAVRDVRFRKFNIIVSLHPAPHVNGHFEQKVISRLCPNVKLAPKSVRSIELIAVCDAMLTFTSSTLVNALCFNKPAAYFIPKEDPYTNVPIKAQWAPKLSTPKMLWDWVVNSEKTTFDLRKELPENSAETLSNVIVTYLDKIEKK